MSILCKLADVAAIEDAPATLASVAAAPSPLPAAASTRAQQMDSFTLRRGGKAATFAEGLGQDFIINVSRRNWTSRGIMKLIELGLWRREFVGGGKLKTKPMTVDEAMAAAHATATPPAIVSPQSPTAHARGGPRASKAGADYARIRAILDSEEAVGRQTLARHLAYETDLSVERAIEELDGKVRFMGPDAVALEMPPKQARPKQLSVEEEIAQRRREFLAGR